LAKKKAHGERNQKLSKTLYEGKEYYDWAITTAFYSAIHYIEDKIFPCVVGGVNCANINDVNRAYDMPGRHAARERLVWDKLFNVGVQYKWLDDQSRNARYITFKINDATSAKSQQYLNEIYKACYE
jgi:hypothetical protein